MAARRARARLAWLVLPFAAIWLSWLGFSARTAPADNIEQLIWVHSLEWGYYKHPPLPTWLLWPVTAVVGQTPWATYVLGAAVTLGAVIVQYSAIRRMRGENYALLCAAAVLCITYYNGRLYYYNHNTVLMLTSAGTFAATWLALRSSSRRWWLVVGVLLGLGGLAKYQGAITGAAVGCSVMLCRRWRCKAQVQGMALAAVAAAVVFSPHLVWSIVHDFPAVRYAESTSLSAALPLNERIIEVISWDADQLVNRCLPAWLLIALVIVRGRGRRAEAERPVSAQEPAAADAQAHFARTYILIWGLLPIALTCAVGLVAGAKLQPQWGTPFMLFAVPAALELAGGRAARKAVQRRIQVCFWAIQTALVALNIATSPLTPAGLRRGHWPTFDAKRLSDEIASQAREALGGPICLISGPPEISGALSLALPERPRVLIDGDLDISPWVTPALIQNCGTLVLREGFVHRARHDVPDFPKLSWEVVPPAPERAER